MSEMYQIVDTKEAIYWFAMNCGCNELGYRMTKRYCFKFRLQLLDEFMFPFAHQFPELTFYDRLKDVKIRQN